ncbi:MAG: type II toxin-antitoxin system prevent-host-death family antitoxin [Clostridia bacterium]|nr:type II toxin-antitoxin system prevent-host-death family antitoxin [Clostridia bacterium]
MEVTATDFKNNLGYYLQLVRTEDIWIKKNGKRIAKLINSNISAVDSITGILKGTGDGLINRHSIREERLSDNALHD